MNKFNKLIYIVGAVMSLCSCVSKSVDLDVGIDATIPDRWAEADRVGVEEAEELLYDEAQNDDGWLAKLNDVRLSLLVQEALISNPPLLSAKARLDGARFLLKERKAERFPASTLQVSSQQQGRSAENNDSSRYRASFSASWEADLWGRLALGVTETEYAVLSRQADLQSVTQLLAADTAKAYFSLIEAYALVKVERSNLDSLTRTYGFVEVQFERGLRSGEDIALITADVERARARLDQAEQMQRDAIRAIELLLGRYPSARLDFANGLPERPEDQLLGTPLSILERRPDLRAAKLKVLKERTRARKARRDLFPFLRIQGIFDSTTNDLSTLFKASSFASSLLVNATQSVFDGGARRTRAHQADSDIEAAIAEYQALVLGAYREVEAELDRKAVLSKREKHLLSALVKTREALKFSKLRYELGESDLLNVLSIQQRAASIEAEYIRTQRSRLDQYVMLSLALGRKA